MKHNPRYPLKHLSIRVPWHDNSWNGSICTHPKSNGACLVLKSCSTNRNDDLEEELKGKSLSDLQEWQYPVCVGERATFMAPFPYHRTLKHPYVKSSPGTHGHLKDTVLLCPPFSAAAVPYNWMLNENSKEKASVYDLNVDESREPQMDWAKNNTSTWVQEFNNQKALLNGFFEHLEAKTSLVFFYAKQTPFVESVDRVLAGVGKIQEIIPSTAYEGSNSGFSAAYWEHMVLHSIRNNGKGGFLLPYHDALAYQETHLEFDVATLAVLVPADKRFEFSYGTEHVSSDSAIRVLLDCLRSLEKAESLGIGQHNASKIQWIHDEIAALEKLRGAYPGMGSALCAFGIEKGHFVAAEIINKLKDEKENPWDYFEKALDNPESILSEEIYSLIPATSKAVYKKKKATARIQFLQLLSRFDISINQAISLYVEEVREKLGISHSEQDYLKNPYLIYEDLRLTMDPVALSTIDLGLYLKHPPDHLLPSDMLYKDPFETYRLRALVIQQLEQAAVYGHTLLSQKEIIEQLRKLPITPSCQVNNDYFEIAEDGFEDVVICDKMKNGSTAYQLERFAKTSEIIRLRVEERIKARRLPVEAKWSDMLHAALKLHTVAEPDEQEVRARAEKTAALEEIAQSRFSVLIGPAGTGKTTVLTILAGLTEIMNNGVLMLAPTGKARVRMEEVARGMNVTAKTLAQFLSQYDRYNVYQQRYVLSDKYCEGQYQTVILDEASMLTEEMLATTLHCLKGVKRFILVGDHRQLPPIGAGRPFLDIINYLKPTDIASAFPRVARGYAELTIKRRQGGSQRADLQLAEWFSGEDLEPGADSIINHILTTPDSKYLRVEYWEHESDFDRKFEEVLVSELGMSGTEDVATFNTSLGSLDGRFFNFREAAKAAESWQILSPVREKVFGVKAINRKIHKQFRKKIVEYARNKNGKLPAPIGLEEIVYGDKVINMFNSQRSENSVWPKDGALNYVANGEIGMVIGQFKMPNMAFEGQPKYTEIEFTSQKNFKYTFTAKEFGEEGNTPLELAYALTVHKVQGSEFGKVFVVIPNPCFLLSREMIYTALTRHKDKVILLVQGKGFDIQKMAAPEQSDALKRITNLFFKPEMTKYGDVFLEKNLIHQASDGVMLRSKSELLVYQRLLDKQLQPLYEKKLTIKNVEKLPDFTIENDDTGEVYYWEHCGMLTDKEYSRRWDEKYNWYIENGILPIEQGRGENGTLIVTEDKPHELTNGAVRGGISVKEIDALIKRVFNR